jgi:hypothetical protein
MKRNHGTAPKVINPANSALGPSETSLVPN